MKQRYHLAEPKLEVKEMYSKDLEAKLLGDSKTKKFLIAAFKSQQKALVKRMTRVLAKAVCRIAAKRLLHKALQQRKKYAGSLLKTARTVKAFDLLSSSDFGKTCHTASSEPFFYDTAYQHASRTTPIPIDEEGKCVIAKEIKRSSDPKSKQKEPMKWACTSECKTITTQDTEVIVSLKEDFDKPMDELRHVLETCDDGCPNGHYTVNSVSVDDDPPFDAPYLKGHPLVCSLNDAGCNSRLRILRATSVHYPFLVNFLHHLYRAINSHKTVCKIDEALSSGDYQQLMELTQTEDFDSLLSNEVEATYNEGTDVAAVPTSGLRRPNLESELQITHAHLIAQLDKEIDDFPDKECCCCQQLHQRKSVTRVKLSDDLGPVLWVRLKTYILQHNPEASDQTLFMCNYCKPMIKDNKLPARCVLNGLETAKVPTEISKLDGLSRQLIQRAKCYQTIVRLGTYSGKVPHYNSLKACSGTMFFLPLPMSKTLETLDQVGKSGDGSSSVGLPDPELYIVVNGKPTKNKIVWRSLVNIDNIKAAVDKLRQINWLYKDVAGGSIDEAVKQVIEVTNSSTSAMLEKASNDDIAGFRSFTIRNLDNKLSTESDIDQYKLLSVREQALDNRQMHLDVMCFPGLFPTGYFGEFHPREKKISHSEFIKSLQQRV